MTRILLAALAALAAGSALVPRQSVAQATFDGTWRGVARCAGVGGDVLSSPVTITVTGKTLRFNRLVPTPDGRSASGTEYGAGSVAPNGALKAEATLQGPGGSQKSSYAGRIAGEVATLRGGPGDKGGCAIEARRS